MAQFLRSYVLGFFVSIFDILLGSVMSLTYFLLKTKWRVASFLGVLGFALGSIFLPDLQNFWEVKSKIINVASRAGHVSVLCHNFKNFSKEKQEQLNFKDKLNRAQQEWFEANNDLFITITDQYQAGTFGKRIHTEIDKFRKWNILQNEYIETYNACPTNMLTPDEIGTEREKLMNILPLTMGEYVKFYIEVRLLGE